MELAVVVWVEVEVEASYRTDGGGQEWWLSTAAASTTSSQ